MTTNDYLYNEIYDKIERELNRIVDTWAWDYIGDISVNDYYKIVSSALKNCLEFEAQEMKNIHEGEYIEVPDRITD